MSHFMFPDSFSWTSAFHENNYTITVTKTPFNKVWYCTNLNSALATNHVHNLRSFTEDYSLALINSVVTTLYEMHRGNYSASNK